MIRIFEESLDIYPDRAKPSDNVIVLPNEGADATDVQEQSACTVNDECDECQQSVVENTPCEPSVDINELGIQVPDLPNVIEKKQVIDKSFQVKSGDFLTKFTDFISSESDLMTLCNIKSFSILNELTRLMDKIYPQKKKGSLSTRERIILTAVK